MLLFVNVDICYLASLHLSSVKVHRRVRVLIGQESCQMKERES